MVGIFYQLVADERNIRPGEWAHNNCSDSVGTKGREAVRVRVFLPTHVSRRIVRHDADPVGNGR